jgi:hypothetical protein
MANAFCARPDLEEIRRISGSMKLPLAKSRFGHHETVEPIFRG